MPADLVLGRSFRRSALLWEDLACVVLPTHTPSGGTEDVIRIPRPTMAPQGRAGRVRRPDPGADQHHHLPIQPRIDDAEVQAGRRPIGTLNPASTRAIRATSCSRRWNSIRCRSSSTSPTSSRRARTSRSRSGLHPALAALELPALSGIGHHAHQQGPEPVRQRVHRAAAGAARAVRVGRRTGRSRCR